jgi:hypothetical protein
MSRRPNPTDIKVFGGNKHKGKINRNEPNFQIAIPDPSKLLDEVGISD